MLHLCGFEFWHHLNWDTCRHKHATKIPDKEKADFSMVSNDLSGCLLSNIWKVFGKLSAKFGKKKP